MSSKDTQSRKWLITINNPIDKGYTHEFIKIQLAKFKSCIYWCMSDETGEEGTFHTHIYIHCTSGVRFSTVKNRFDGGHFDLAKGTAQENRDYVFKEGKWTNSDKEHTNIKESHEEYGEVPIERQGARNDLADLYDMIKGGMSTYEILEQCPQYVFQTDKIERVRQVILEESYRDVWRDVEVTYIWGVTGTGKTRGVMDEYGYRNVFRVTNYDHPFDTYKGQDVVVFDEFRSSLKLGEMLDYLDGYPVEMKARYADKQACFHKVYIISNIDIRQQFPDKQETEPLSWEAFLRRIDKVKYYNGESVFEMPLREYMKRSYHFLGKTPFDKEKGDNVNND